MKPKKHLYRHQHVNYQSVRVWVNPRVIDAVTYHCKCCDKMITEPEIVIKGYCRRYRDYNKPIMVESDFGFYKKYRHGYRRPKTIQEHRANSEYPEFKRKGRILPRFGFYDDPPLVDGVKSWKDVYKCRKQWMKNQ